ncbi:MAG: DUF4976 domain-containing protein, partial [Opitutae bacterium]|nr:DUF4976 domain-containing protein [Opitutae bacterium]
PKGAGPIDGVDLMPLLKGEENLERGALFWHYPHYSNQGGFPGGAVRMGKFKLIERFEDGKLDLYDLSKDIGERNNVAAQHPEKIQKMQAKLHAWYKDVDAKFLQPKSKDGPKPWRP